MNDKQEDAPENPMHHPDEQPAGIEAPFKLGKLLLLLAAAIMLLVVLALIMETYFT